MADKKAMRPWWLHWPKGERSGMLNKTADVVGLDTTPSWQRLLRGLWLSGLRISEAVNLSWSADSLVQPSN